MHSDWRAGHEPRSGSAGIRAATAAARRLLESEQVDAAAAVDQMFQWIVNSPPSDPERDSVLTFVQGIEEQLAAEGADDARLKAWSLACHALFASSRFQILE